VEKYEDGSFVKTIGDLIHPYFR